MTGTERSNDHERALRGRDGMTPTNRQSPTPREGSLREAQRRPWIPPTVEDLPKLTDLTLITGNPIHGGGDTGGGGSSVF
jgi:hypothetical protein